MSWNREDQSISGRKEGIYDCKKASQRLEPNVSRTRIPRRRMRQPRSAGCVSFKQEAQIGRMSLDSVLDPLSVLDLAYGFLPLHSIFLKLTIRYFPSMVSSSHFTMDCLGSSGVVSSAQASSRSVVDRQSSIWIQPHLLHEVKWNCAVEPWKSPAPPQTPPWRYHFREVFW